MTQFHFTAWPDHGVPDYATPILAFHRRVGKEHRPKKGPMMVHCRLSISLPLSLSHTHTHTHTHILSHSLSNTSLSLSAGVGRTGTFITIDQALEQVAKEGKVDIAGIINRIRHQRMKLVQTVVSGCGCTFCVVPPPPCVGGSRVGSIWPARAIVTVLFKHSAIS